MSTVLPLRDMHLRHRGLTRAVAENNSEAATVCLSRHHASPITFSIANGESTSQVMVDWLTPDERTRAAWANQIDATEMGAYACVIAGLELARGHFAVHRAETGTGADYYVGPEDSGVDDLEGCYRLEVSGIDGGSDRDVRVRLLQKIEQTRRGHSSLPAIAGVVGFAARLIALGDAELL